MIKQEYLNITKQLRDTILAEIAKAAENLPPIIPCKVISKTGPTVTVLPTLNLGVALQVMTNIPIAKSRYHNDPIQAGDKGMLVPASYLFDGLILAGTDASPLNYLTKPLPSPNLGGYMFVPLSDVAQHLNAAGDVEAIYSQDGAAYVALDQGKITLTNAATNLLALMQNLESVISSALSSAKVIVPPGTSGGTFSLTGYTFNAPDFTALLYPGTSPGPGPTPAPTSQINTTTVSGNHTVNSEDALIRCNGTLTIFLPASRGSGQLLYIKNVGTGVVTISPNGSDTIDGQASLLLNMQYQGNTICDGSSGNWDILA